MSAPFPIERWASRSPAVRWPLVLALIVVLIGLAGGITACGGGSEDDGPDVKITPPNCAASGVCT